MGNSPHHCSLHKKKRKEGPANARLHPLPARELPLHDPGCSGGARLGEHRQPGLPALRPPGAISLFLDRPPPRRRPAGDPRLPGQRDPDGALLCHRWQGSVGGHPARRAPQQPAPGRLPPHRDGGWHDRPCRRLHRGDFIVRPVRRARQRLGRAHGHRHRLLLHGGPSGLRPRPPRHPLPVAAGHRGRCPWPRDHRGLLPTRSGGAGVDAAAGRGHRGGPGLSQAAGHLVLALPAHRRRSLVVRLPPSQPPPRAGPAAHHSRHAPRPPRPGPLSLGGPQARRHPQRL